MFKASIIGNLGNDPDLRYSASGSPLLRFNLAANYRTRTPEGEWAEKTEWVRCTVFGNRAESLNNLLKKGTRVYVEGRLEARPWTSQAGEIRAGLELAVNEVEMMTPRSAEDGQGRPPARGGIPTMGQDDDTDDIPF